MLSIITPSYIDSPERLAFAQASLASLHEAVGTTYPHIVIDDLPRRRGVLGRFFVNRELRGAAERVYDHPHISLRRRPPGGSASALREAIRQARADGSEHVFIHLDDNVYVPMLAPLLRHAQDAFGRDAELVKVRLAGYPILWSGCTPKNGNRSILAIEEDVVRFDRIRLRPTRYTDYTLWWSHFNTDMIGEKSYPVVLWSTLYRADWLERILTWEGARACRSLADIELYYLNPLNWGRLLLGFSGKLGYINMQFCGIEMEHSSNWAELISYPNDPVR